ncbi:MAG TPA: FliM/FliN family flagellar motor switch protein [Steroidobacteraceae bacterium]|nr:FliM/FliN family flagellar motor switch protein [Steroidobacteraceae bacterium]
MPEAQARAAISDEEVSALLEKNGADAVRPYDFAAQRINRMQLPLLEVVSKSFAERAGASLSTLLGRDAAMQFTSLESAKSADLQAALPVPASLAVVRLKPLPGFAFVSVEPGLLLTLLDGFFGGSGRAALDPQAAIAPAAQRFLALMLRSFAADLAAAWAPVTPLELELVKQETNPRLVQLGAPLEALLVVKFTVEFGARSGRIDWLLPEVLLAPVREALAADGGQTTLRKQEAWAPALTAALQDAELDTRAVLAQAQISLRELVRLSPGDIIPIEPPQQVTLFAGNVPLYRGRFGVSQGRNALKILPGAPT